LTKDFGKRRLATMQEKLNSDLPMTTPLAALEQTAGPLLHSTVAAVWPHAACSTRPARDRGSGSVSSATGRVSPTAGGRVQRGVLFCA